MRFIGLSGSDGTKRFQHSAINYVYALFYKGECVYIGITRNPNSRETDHHRSTGKMFDEMRVITSNIDNIGPPPMSEPKAHLILFLSIFSTF